MRRATSATSKRKFIPSHMQTSSGVHQFSCKSSLLTESMGGEGEEIQEKDPKI